MIVQNLHVISKGLHIVPIYVDENHFKIKVFTFTDKKPDPNQKVYVLPNCKRTYIAPNSKQNFSKSFLSVKAPEVHIKKSPLIKDDLEFRYQATDNGGFIYTKQVTRNKRGWGSTIEIFYSPKPIKMQMYKLSQLENGETKIDTLLQPYPIEYDQHIPKQLIQTGFKPYDELNKVKVYSEIWKEYNPDYKYRYFSELDCYNYMKARYGDKIANTWNAISYGAIKADVFRACIIAEEGGVYVDLGTFPFVPLKSIIQPQTLLLMTKDRRARTTSLFNAFFASTPQHGMMIMLRNVILHKLMTTKIHLSTDGMTRQTQIHNLFGPGLFGKVFMHFFKMKTPIIPLNLGKLIILDHNYEPFSQDKRRLVRSLSDLLFEKEGFDSPYYRNYKKNVSFRNRY